MADEILLESGTNEVEILEFFLQGQSLGINVAKIAQIVPFERAHLTKLPGDEPAMLGSLTWQGKTISLIDLGVVLRPNKEKIVPKGKPIVLVTEFNNVTNGFLCDGVNRIHRISWDKLDPLSGYLEKYSSMLTGSINLEDRDVLMVDFEYIISELYPETKMGFDFEDGDGGGAPALREKMKIVFAEDSPFIRSTIVELLIKAGYSQISSHENGEEAYGYIKGIIKDVKDSGANLYDHLNLVISDIEMPKMDGLTLCKKLKTELGLQETPVIIFSSLINEQMIQKCKEVHANGYTTKPQINELVQIMDAQLGVSCP